MTKAKKTLTCKKKAVLAARCLEGKKASDIILLEVSGVTTIADYFVIATGESQRQIKACADYIEESLSIKGEKPHHLEGIINLEWVLMDYGDVIVHIFDKEARLYYGLERLWGDVPKVDYRVKKRKTEVRSKMSETIKEETKIEERQI